VVTNSSTDEDITVCCLTPDLGI